MKEIMGQKLCSTNHKVAFSYRKGMTWIIHELLEKWNGSMPFKIHQCEIFQSSRDDYQDINT